MPKTKREIIAIKYSEPSCNKVPERRLAINPALIKEVKIIPNQVTQFLFGLFFSTIKVITIKKTKTKRKVKIPLSISFKEE